MEIDETLGGQHLTHDSAQQEKLHIILVSEDNLDIRSSFIIKLYMKGRKDWSKNAPSMRRPLCVQSCEKAKTPGLQGYWVLEAVTNLLVNTREIPLVYAQCDWENRTLVIFLTSCISFVSKHDWTKKHQTHSFPFLIKSVIRFYMLSNCLNLSTVIATHAATVLMIN